MNATDGQDGVDHDRRQLCGGAALAALAGSLLASGPTKGQPNTGSATAALRTFGSLQQIEAGALDVGFADVGPSDGHPVILLHGWPYDIHSFVDVAPLLASAGYRVIIPHLRGYGSTHFRSADTIRNAQQSALALDVIALMDALHLDRVFLAGFDWGARTANIVAAL